VSLLAVLRALSATMPCPGGPNNAAELNRSSRWASLDVREAKKLAALPPCPVFPCCFLSVGPGAAWGPRTKSAAVPLRPVDPLDLPPGGPPDSVDARGPSKKSAALPPCRLPWVFPPLGTLNNSGNTWGLRFPPPAWAVRWASVVVLPLVGPNDSVTAWGPSKKLAALPPCPLPWVFSPVGAPNNSGNTWGLRVPPPAWAVRWVFVAVTAAWAASSWPLSTSLA